MNYDHVIQKVQKLQGDGEFSRLESELIEKALKAWRQRFWLVVLVIPLITLGAMGRASLWRSRDLPSPGTTRYHSEGAVWEFRWVSSPPKRSITFFTGEGRWVYHPGSRGGIMNYNDEGTHQRFQPGREPWRPPPVPIPEVDDSMKPPETD